MKIVISSYDDLSNPYYAGGGATAIHELAKRLAKNHNVTVLTGRYSNCKNIVLDGVFYKRIGVPFLEGPKIGQIIFQFSLPFCVRKYDFDIWMESFTPPFSTACLQLFTKKPVVALTHLLGARDMSKKYWNLPFHWIEDFGIKTYKYAIALTDYIKERFDLLNPYAKVVVIPNGLSSEFLSIVPSITKGRHILFIGRIDIRQKGLDVLIDAYKKIEDLKVPLVIAGSGKREDEDLIKKRIKSLSLEGKILCIGKVSGEKRLDVFRKSKILILPSRFETQPLSILEAYCFGIPALISDIPQLEWIPNNTCVRFKKDDVIDLAQKMRTILTNDKERFTKGKNAKKYIKNYSWDNVSLKYEKFLLSII